MSWPGKLFPIGVSGFVYDEQGNLLLCRRSDKVTQYTGCFECPPAGNLTSSNPMSQLLDELREEVGLDQESIVDVQPLALYRDKHYNQLDLAYGIKINKSLTSMEFADNDECKEFVVLPVAELEQFLTNADAVPECQLFPELYRTLV